MRSRSVHHSAPGPCPRPARKGQPHPARVPDGLLGHQIDAEATSLALETPALAPRAAGRPRWHQLGHQLDPQPQLDPSPNPDPEIKAQALEASAADPLRTPARPPTAARPQPRSRDQGAGPGGQHGRPLRDCVVTSPEAGEVTTQHGWGPSGSGVWRHIHCRHGWAPGSIRPVRRWSRALSDRPGGWPRAPSERPGRRSRRHQTGGKALSHHAAEVTEPRPAIFASVPHPRKQSMRPKSQGKSGVESAVGQLTKEKRQEISALSTD